MRNIKHILKDVLVEFYKHDSDYHYHTSKELITEIVKYIDQEQTICPICKSTDVKLGTDLIKCYSCGAII